MALILTQRCQVEEIQLLVGERTLRSKAVRSNLDRPLLSPLNHHRSRQMDTEPLEKLLIDDRCCRCKEALPRKVNTHT